MASNTSDTGADGADEADQLIEQVSLVVASSNRQHWLAIICLFSMPILLAVFVTITAKLVKRSDSILAIEPVNRTAVFSGKIDKVKAGVEKKFLQHHQKMQDPTIAGINRKFKQLYALSLQSDIEYAQSMEQYQAATFQLASKTRGSGEWYFYHKKMIDQLHAGQKQRAQQISDYIDREP